MSTVERNAKDALAAVQERIQKAAQDGELDQRRAPLLEALRAYHECEPASFSIPAHKGGASLDELTREVLGEGPYRADAPAHKGRDDRVSSYRLVQSSRRIPSSPSRRADFAAIAWPAVRCRSRGPTRATVIFI